MALSEDKLLAYCLDEVISSSEFVGFYNPWCNFLWINKLQVIETMKYIYKNIKEPFYNVQTGAMRNHYLIVEYQRYLEESTRKRIEAN